MISGCMTEKVAQVLYSGLGGHGSVAFSLIEGDLHCEVDHSLLFYGVEDLLTDYINKAKKLQIDFLFVKKNSTLKSWIQAYMAFKALKPATILLHSHTLGIVAFVYRLIYGAVWIVVDHQSGGSLKHWLLACFNIVFCHKYVVLTDVSADTLPPLSMLFKSKITVIPNGIDTSYFVAKQNENKKIISMTARINPVRDFTTLVKAFDSIAKKYTDIELVIAGDGPDFQKLQQLKERSIYKERIHLLGTIDEEGVLGLLQKTKIYVHSSLADTMCTSIMQAMSCGLPVIATDIHGINNMITHRVDGLLFQARSPLELAEKICVLLENENLCVSLGQNARKKAEKAFSHIAMFEAYRKIILN